MTGAQAAVTRADQAREELERARGTLDALDRQKRLHDELDRAYTDLRTDLNVQLRPEMSEIASAFLTELTDARYTELELDDSYNLTLLEDAVPKPVISGGEQDIANLCLRLAISQMIAERAGQSFSLLILDEAQRHGRKVAFAGYSMIQNVELALRTGTIKVPKDTVVKMEDLVKQPDGKVLLVCTGSQGEFNAVLNRMASGAHKHIKVKSSDVVVFSSNPIPGNEKYVVRTVDGLMREGSGVIQNGKSHLTGIGPIHVSGHGYYDDHIKLINAVNPTYYLPIHGEFHMLVHNAEDAKRLGVIEDADHQFRIAGRAEVCSDRRSPWAKVPSV